MQTSISFVLINYYTSIAPLDLTDGSGDGAVGQISPLSFGKKAKWSILDIRLYSPSASIDLILQKSISVDASIDFYVTPYQTRAKNSFVDIIADISAPSCSLDIVTVKTISFSSLIDFDLVNRKLIDTTLDVLLGIRRYKKFYIEFILQEEHVIETNIDLELLLSGVLSSVDLITTPSVLGERDIQEFNATIQPIKLVLGSVSLELDSDSSVQESLEANTSITMLLEKEVNI